MGYYSDVRIKLTESDYNKLAEAHEEWFRNTKMYELEYAGLFKGAGLVKEVSDRVEIRAKTHDVIMFGWNNIKWYNSYGEVEFIMNFIRKLKHYSFCRVGEESGDIEEEQSGRMPCVELCITFA